MTSHDTAEVESVAKGLTKAQREVILKLRPAAGRQRAIDFSGSTAAALRLPNSKRGALTDRDMARKKGLRTAWYFLTPLGLAVRAHILERKSHDE